MAHSASTENETAATAPIGRPASGNGAPEGPTSGGGQLGGVPANTQPALTATEKREYLNSALLADDPTQPLWDLVNSGLAEQIAPELPQLSLEQDPVHRHKDVLAHTIAVVAKTRPELTLRLAALFHDIGKPATRSYAKGTVTFYHHEAVGAKITKQRLRALEYPKDVVRDVAELVRLSGRFKGYADGWSDSAVRRYVRDAGHLFGLLNELVRSDCTTQNSRVYAHLQMLVDHLEQRVQDLAQAEQKAAERPLLDGNAVMERLEIPPGPQVGEALRFLLDLKQTQPELSVEETADQLDAWWARRQQG